MVKFRIVQDGFGVYRIQINTSMDPNIQTWKDNPNLPRSFNLGELEHVVTEVLQKCNSYQFNNLTKISVVKSY